MSTSEFAFKSPGGATTPNTQGITEFDIEFDPNSGWILLLYGPSGAGKTYFAGTAQDSLYLNTGGGVDTLKSPLFLAKYPNIRRMSRDIFDTPQATGFDLVRDVIRAAMDNLEIRNKIKTIILDDASSFRALAINDALKKKSLDITKFNEIDGMDKARYEMNRIDWFLEHFVPIFRNEGINFLMIAHEARIYGTTDKKGNERPLKEIRPAFAGEKNIDYVPGKFDEVWYISKQHNERTGEFSQIKTGGTGIELVKSRRAGVFARYEIGKDFEMLLKQRKENKLHPSYQR